MLQIAQSGTLVPQAKVGANGPAPVVMSVRAHSDAGQGVGGVPWRRCPVRRRRAGRHSRRVAGAQSGSEVGLFL